MLVSLIIFFRYIIRTASFLIMYSFTNIVDRNHQHENDKDILLCNDPSTTHNFALNLSIVLIFYESFFFFFLYKFKSNGPTIVTVLNLKKKICSRKVTITKHIVSLKEIKKLNYIIIICIQYYLIMKLC